MNKIKIMFFFRQEVFNVNVIGEIRYLADSAAHLLSKCFYLLYRPVNGPIHNLMGLTKLAREF